MEGYPLAMFACIQLKGYSCHLQCDMSYPPGILGPSMESYTGTRCCPVYVAVGSKALEADSSHPVHRKEPVKDANRKQGLAS